MLFYLREVAKQARDKGLRPIDCPEIMEALAVDGLDVLALIADVWGILADKYDKQEQSAEYARRYPFYPGKRYGL